MAKDDEPGLYKKRPYRPTPVQWGFVGFIVALTAGGLAYRVLLSNRLEQTAALFIGLPAFLAALLVLTPKTKSNVGAATKGIAIALLLSGPVLGEGFICILMASPLFFLVGVIVGLAADNQRKRPERWIPRAAILLPLVLMSLEGVLPETSFEREESVTVTRRLLRTRDEVLAALSAGPMLKAPLPLYLRLGFPRPVKIVGNGLFVGARRTIDFAGGEGRPGTLIVEIAEASRDVVRFRATSDTSHVAHWLRWREGECRLRSIGPHETEVTTTLRFRRDLDPAWYFGPWQRYAVGLVAKVVTNDLVRPKTL